MSGHEDVFAESTMSAWLTPIPFDASDVCPVCRSWRHERFPLCSNCLEIEADLKYLCRRVIPTSLYIRDSNLRTSLKYYKDPDCEASVVHERILRTIWCDYIQAQLSRLQALLGGFNKVVLVPSTSGHSTLALRRVIEASPPIKTLIPQQPIIWSGAPVAHRAASLEAFDASTSVFPRDRVLVVDDVYTTGAHAQSVALAVEKASGTTVGILVVARRVNPEFNEAADRVWRRQVCKTYSFAEALGWLEET